MSRKGEEFRWIVFSDAGCLVGVFEAREDADIFASFLRVVRHEYFGYREVPSLDGIAFPGHTITVSTLNGVLLGRFEEMHEALFFAAIRTASEALPRFGERLSLIVENKYQKIQVTNGEVHMPGGSDAE